AAMPLGHAAQFSQGILQPLAETLEALREADGCRFPVGVGQHEVINHVVKNLSSNGHPQVAHVREVGGAQPAGWMDLAEEDFLGWSGLGAPAVDVPLQGPQLRVGKASRKAALQVRKDGFGLEAGLAFEQATDLGPDLAK